MLLSVLFASLLPVKAGTPPNILFLLTDDQRNDTLGCAGHPIIQTPNIDDLAKNGVHFTNSFVSHSICWVSRATLLTGRTCRSFGLPDRPDTVKPEAVADLNPDVMRAAGYRTALFGKWHVKGPAELKPQQHFDSFEAIHRNPYYKKQPDGTLRHETELIGDRAKEFLREQSPDRPFMLSLWFNAAHAEDGDKRPGIGHYPWTKATHPMYEDIRVPPPRLGAAEIFDSQPQFLKDSINRERFFWRWDTPDKYQSNIRAYFRMITGIDIVLGEIRDVLKERGLADNTIIVYSADNGYYMGDRGFAGKWSHYEQSLRVPLIIYDPRLPESQRGRKVDQLAVNFDLPATFVDWSGTKIPDSYQGRSLKAIVEGDENVWWRTDFFCEHVCLAPNITWEGVRDQRYVYARYFDQQPVYEFLHDLQTDPDQLTNFADNADYAPVLQKMRSRCDELVSQYGGPLVPLEQRPSTVYPRRAKR
ncbi:MAG: sulfatase [Planctomycetaceae bacterium]|nr:sulfatase [Planctomycetaceae bacterium]